MKGSSNPSPTFPLERYLEHRAEISLHMSHFLLGYLKELHQAFNGDLALVIVLGEIAHHTLSPHFSAHGVDRDSIQSAQNASAGMRRLPSCSAYSLAAATGLPRETVRRKIARLIELGWAEKVARAEVRITGKVADHFVEDFNVKLLTGLLDTADRIRGAMAP
jgi:hypothetical protein